MKIVTFKEKELLKKELDLNKVIAFPTETVFGLAANSKSIDAFNELVKIKNRRPDKPFTLMCHSKKQIEELAYINEIENKIIDKFMPGSITILLKHKENVKEYLHLNSEYLGFRIPNDKELLDFLRFYNIPLLVPSANKSDEKPALTINQLKTIFDKEINVAVFGECKEKISSTVLRIEKNDIIILREGPIKLQEIKEALK